MSYGYTHIGRAVVPEANLGAAHEDVTLETSDGLQLEGWYVPSKNRAAVIAFAGRKGTQRPTRMLVRHGYGVLLFDRRGEGDSEGDPNAFGWDGEKDLRAALAFLRDRPDVDPEPHRGDRPVGGRRAAAPDRGSHRRAEGGRLGGSGHPFGARRSLEDDGIEKWLGLPFWSATTAGTAVFGNKGPPANLNDLVKEIAPRAVYLIYAKRGQGGEDLSATFYESAGEPKALWETDSGHVGGQEAQPVEYERRVMGFFDRFLLERDEVSRHGTNTPCVANRVFGVVSASPSGPPSKTSIWPSCQMARMPSLTAPGVTASTVVVTEHVAPIDGSGVAVHGTVNANGLSVTVPSDAPPAGGRVVLVGDPGRDARAQLAGVVGQVGAPAHVGDLQAQRARRPRRRACRGHRPGRRGARSRSRPRPGRSRRGCRP